MTILLSLYFFFYLIIAYFRPSWALFLLLALLPSYLIRFSLFSIPLTLLEGMILISLLVFVFRKRKELFSFKKRETSRLPYPFSWEIILWLILAFGAIFTANLSLAAFGVFKAYFLEPAFLFILLINYFPGLEGYKKIIYALSGGALLVSLVVILQKFGLLPIFSEYWSSTGRMLGVFSFPNAVGLYLAPLILLFLNLWRKEKDLIKKVYLSITIILSFLAILTAKSEGALIAVVFSFIICLFFWKKPYRLFSIIVVVIGIASFFFSPAIKSYVTEKFFFRDLSGQIKKQQWIETKKMLYAGHWLWGSGLSNYPQAVAPFHNKGIFVNDGSPDFWEKIKADASFRDSHWQPTEIYLYPHNIFLNFWVELGLLGLLLFLWLVIKSAYLSKDLGVIGAFLAIFIHGLVDVPYFKNDLSVMFFTILALSAIMILTKKYGNPTKIYFR